jgi:hypothetical protein
MYNMNEYASSPSFTEQPKLVFCCPSAGLVPSAMALALAVAVAVTPSDGFECVGVE